MRALLPGSLLATTWIGLLLSATAPGSGAQVRPDRSVLAPVPDWAVLDRWQGLLSRDEFAGLLNGVYAPGNAAAGIVEVRGDHARVRTSGSTTRAIRFREPGTARRAAARYWRSRPELTRRTAARPLRGVHVALDPGHLGGSYARMEERWYRHGEFAPVTEGDMTLLTARLLKPRLEALGARVSLVRSRTAPVTRRRPEDFLGLAREELHRLGVDRPRPRYNPAEPPGNRWNSLQWQSEKLFYRASEIRARADRVNRRLRPDLVVCLHFNAEAWGDPRRPTFVPRNHLHVLVNGTYSAGELRLEDQRLEMLTRLMQMIYPEEVALADAVATAMARQTGLPAYSYTTDNARRTTRNPYVYARNLLANRLYQCPVVFLEPYVMNSEEVLRRVEAGHYEGLRTVAGRPRRSIYAEYADGVRDGLARFYQPSP